MSSSAPEKVVARVKLARHRSVVVKVVASVLSVINRRAESGRGCFCFCCGLPTPVCSSPCRFLWRGAGVKVTRLGVVHWGVKCFVGCCCWRRFHKDLSILARTHTHARIYMYCRCNDKIILSFFVWIGGVPICRSSATQLLKINGRK